MKDVTFLCRSLEFESDNSVRTVILEKFFRENPDIDQVKELYETDLVQSSTHLKHLMQREMRSIEYKSCDQGELTTKEFVLGLLGFVKKS